jgi:hypothetical protein
VTAFTAAVEAVVVRGLREQLPGFSDPAEVGRCSIPRIQALCDNQGRSRLSRGELERTLAESMAVFCKREGCT